MQLQSQRPAAAQAEQKLGQLLQQLTPQAIGKRVFNISEAISTEMMYRLLHNAMDCECARCNTAIVDDAQTLDHLERIAKTLTSTSRKFGLLLAGIPGNGKTTTAYAVRRALLMLAENGLCDEPHMHFVVARDLAAIVKDEPEYFEKLCTLPGLIIDDLGDEPAETMHYGSIITPATDLLLKRYARRLFTICTTNLRPEELKAKYGERVSDRLREMFDVIGFRNASYR